MTEVRYTEILSGNIFYWTIRENNVTVHTGSYSQGNYSPEQIINDYNYKVSGNTVYINGTKVYPTGGDVTTYTINTQKNMTGTVEIITGGLVWHLTSPVVGDIHYGAETDIPATWIDLETGNEELAVIRGNTVYLDKGLTGDIGEVTVKLTDVIIKSQVTGKTVQLEYTPTNNLILYGIGALFLAGAYIILRKKKE